MRPSRWFRLLGCAVLLVWTAPGSARAQVRSEIYGFVHADPAVVEQAVRAVVTDPRKVVYNPARQEILVIADAATQAQVRQLITQLDRPAPNVRIEVSFAGEGVSSDLGGALRVEGELLGRRGERPAGSLTLDPSLRAGDTTTRQNASQWLVAQSGKEARLAVGQRVPHLEWLMTRGLAFSTTQARVQWQNVGAFLVIQPVVVGEGANRRVKVRVIPELSGQVDGAPHQIRFSRVATDVLARDGESVDLGGLAEQNEVFSRFLVGFDRQQRQTQLSIRLTPTILD